MVAPTTIYYEGSPALREGFSGFFSGISGARPKLVDGKSFANTIRAFVIAAERGGAANFLLVDSDGPDEGRLLRKVTGNPEWKRGATVPEGRVHFMVEIMESWLLADKDALEAYYGQGFRPARLPANPRVEQIPKDDVTDGLHDATRDTGKGPYNKTKHAPSILARVDADKVRDAAPSCSRLFRAIESAAGGPA